MWPLASRQCVNGSVVKLGSLRWGGLAASTWLALSGCGGGGSSGDDRGTPTQLAAEALVPAQTAAQFEAYYKKGVQNIISRRQSYVAVEMPTANAVNSADAMSGASYGASSTNVVEAGVDEADSIKQNDSFVYTLQNPPIYYATAFASTPTNNDDPLGQGVYKLNIFAKPSAQRISNLVIDGEFATGIYLVDNTILAVAEKRVTNWLYANIAANSNGKTEVDLVDVSNASAPSIKQHYEWDGDFVASRRIGDSLFVVSNFGMPYADSSSVTVPQNLSQSNFLPITANGLKLDSANCLIPQQIADANIVPSIVLITQISISNAFSAKTTCISASSPEVYVGMDALYLLGQDWENNRTRIHKFSLLDNALNYRASGSVPGVIDWQNPYFSVSEYKNVLRIMTNDRRLAMGQMPTNDSGNKLFTLRESETEVGGLEQLAVLPNANHPDPIGSYLEHTQAIRFLGKDAYVVTFHTIDPLYKLDLSDPTDPHIAGELELPGYSAYLQKINDQYLLGVGYSVDSSGRQNAVQLSVFDTSEAVPRLVSQDTIERADNNWISLPLHWDYHAMSSASNGDSTRILFPYQQYNYSENYTLQSKLAEYEINELSGAIVRDALPVIDDAQNRSISRSIFDANTIYSMVDDGSLFKSNWGE